MASQPKGIVRSQRNCCVVGCYNSETKNVGLHFYRFPGRKWEVERKQAWINAVNRPGIGNEPWTPKDHTRICSAHFAGGAKSESQHTVSYVPTIFPNASGKNDALSEWIEPAVKKTRYGEITDATQRSTCDSLFEIVNVKCEVMEVETLTTGCQTEPWFDQPVNETNVLFCWNGENESSTQTQIYIRQPLKSSRIIVDRIVNKLDKASGSDDEMSHSLWKFLEITTDTTMRQLTGISLTFFLTLLNLIVPNRGGQPAYFKKLGKEDRLFLFLLKMKLGVSFCALGCLFHVHSSTASRTFFQILDTLSDKTRDWIFWPSRENVRRCLPSTFGRYPNLRYIIGCVEVSTETPASAEQKLVMYSVKRETSTVKFLIAVTPDGNVCQTSKGYGGNSEMRRIIVDSGFLSILESGDSVMGDKSFSTIETELARLDVTLVISQIDSDETKKGLVKIRENRAMQKIKMLRVLDNFSMEMLPHKDSIIHMCCVIANGRPIVNPENKKTDGIL